MKPIADTLGSLKHPLAFYGLVVLVVESVIAVAAASSLDDAQLMFWLFIVLIGVLILVVGVVSFIVVKYPRHLLGEFEDAIQTVIQQLSEFHRRRLVELARDGQLKYKAEERSRYKDLRNAGLVRTSKRGAMRYDDTLLITPLGSLVARELGKAT